MNVSALRERKGGLARAFLVTEKKGEELCGCHGNLGVFVDTLFQWLPNGCSASCILCSQAYGIPELSSWTSLRVGRQMQGSQTQVGSLPLLDLWPVCCVQQETDLGTLLFFGGDLLGSGVHWSHCGGAYWGWGDRADYNVHSLTPVFPLSNRYERW